MTKYIKSLRVRVINSSPAQITYLLKWQVSLSVSKKSVSNYTKVVSGGPFFKKNVKAKIPNCRLVSILMGLPNTFECISHDLLVAERHSFDLNFKKFLILYTYLKD